MNAIFLAETRIQIDERCTECGLCVASCPLGAIRPEQETRQAKYCRANAMTVVVLVEAQPFHCGSRGSHGGSLRIAR